MSVDAIARAVLYEGYSLYPYRESALKNRRRMLFGTLFPRVWAERSGTGDAAEAATECLLSTRDRTRVDVSVRFLTLRDEGPMKEAALACDELTIDELIAGRTMDDTGLGARATVTAVACDGGVVRIRVNVENVALVATDASRDQAEHFALAATHVVLRARDGAWISLIEPPALFASEAARCVQRGLWPVLAGTDAVLASPIILYDHPAVAPESAAGDMFDATEIEEILALRVQTLTTAEKAELRHDEVTRALLDRVEALGPGELAKLHGVLRKLSPRSPLTPGDRVTLRPGKRADALDTLLDGMAATVVSIEETIEGESLVCVTIDADPGRDLGEKGFPGHRFFFRTDELVVRGGDDD